MFKKCLKYDLGALHKIWLPAAAIVLALGLVCCLVGASCIFSFIIEIDKTTTNPDYVPEFTFFIQLFLGMISIFVMSLSAIVLTLGTSVGNYIRYYTHLFSDQGYLTFTLPVKRSTLFWSKATGAYLYSVAAAAVVAVIVAFGIICAIASVFAAFIHIEEIPIREILSQLTPTNIAELWNLFWSWVGAEIGLAWIFRILLILFLLLVLYLSAEFASLMTGYFCITIGATMFRKLKLLSALIVYYVVNNVLSVPAIYILSYYFAFAGMFGAYAIPKLFTNLHVGMSVIYLLLAIASLALITIGLAMAFFSIWRLDKKLNLA